MKAPTKKSNYEVAEEEKVEVAEEVAEEVVDEDVL